MAYNAVVCKVMIAGPSDVVDEKKAARKVVLEWNDQHSEDKKIVLLPVAWETHSAPAMGDRPQAIINKQVLEGSDLLIGIFGRRLGTPTGQAPSGTVEEINKHCLAGKPAMLYFSSADVPRGERHSNQLQRLEEFKEECQENARIEEYANIPDFEHKLAWHLVKTVNDDEYFKKIGGQATNSPVLEAGSDTGPEQILSKEARDLLLEAVQDPNGFVLMLMTSSGLTIQANSKNMVTDPRDGRCQAVWQGALDELVEEDLLADRGYEGQSFRVTREGYALADRLKALG